MKKGHICALLAAVIVTFTILGCSGSGGPPGGLDFVGTWQQSGGGLTETIVFTSKTFSVSDTGPYTGAMDCSIQAVDTGATHIKMAVTSTTGLYTSIPNSTVLYILYNVSGNTMYLGMSAAGYPSSTTLGPYTKQ